MNNKAIYEFGFHWIWRIKQISEGVIVDRLGKLPSKEQQLSRTQHFIFKARAAIFVLHIQYGPSGTPLSPMVQRQNCLLSTHVKLLGPAKQNHGYLTSLHRIRSDEISDKERRVRKFPTLEMTDFCEKEMKGTFSSPLHPRAIRALHLRQKLIINLRWR